MKFIYFFYTMEYLIHETKSFLLGSSNICACLHPPKKTKTTKYRQALSFSRSSSVPVAISIVIHLSAVLQISQSF